MPDRSLAFVPLWFVRLAWKQPMLQLLIWLSELKTSKEHGWWAILNELPEKLILMNICHIFFGRWNGSKQNGTKLAFLLLLTGLLWWLEDFRVSLFLMSFICAPIASTKVFICSSVNRRKALSTLLSTWQELKYSVTHYQQTKHWGVKI